MFGLCMGLWKLFFAKKQYQVLILGLDEAGKTTLLEQLRHMFAQGPSVDTLKIPHTVGLNIGKFDVERAKVLFWDLGGQVGLRILWEKYFTEAHGLIYVIDTANPARFSESQAELEKVLLDPELTGAPVLVLANKQDLDRSLTSAQVSDQLQLSSESRPVRVQSVSTLSGDGIKEGVQWLLRVIPACPRTDRMSQGVS